jgi:hypothetical protein
MYRKFTLQKKVTVLTPYLRFRSSTIPGRQQALANVQCASTLSVLSQRIQPVGHHSLEEQLIVLLELAIGGLPLGDGMECRLALVVDGEDVDAAGRREELVVVGWMARWKFAC